MFRTVIFILAAVISGLVTGRLVGATGWLRAIDYPNQRSSHVRPTPRSGGLGIVTSFVLLLPLLWIMLLPEATNWRFALRFGLALFGYIVIAIVGLIDDMRSIHPLTKYLGQLVAALIAIWSGVTFLFLDLPFIGRLDLGLTGRLAGLIGALLTVLWLTGFSNLFNFMDGIDGLAGGSAVIYGLALAFVCSLTDHRLPAAGLLVLAAACLGFLVHNFPPARIFMGDVGSLFIGYTLAAFTVLITNSGVRPVPFPAALLIFAPFLFDPILTLILRWRRGERLHEAHRRHLYQRLVTAGQTHRRVTLTYYALNLIFAGLALCYLPGTDRMRVFLLAGGLTILGGFTIYVRWIEERAGRHSTQS
ncbi:MAG: Undecaprenyl-phosphate N-acetylglucosaminyl 1-phosphate transferase [Acidobacteriota bacterium]